MENNSITIDITNLGLFSGMYETVWLNSDMDIDDLIELGSMLGVPAQDIDADIDHHKYLKVIAELYCEMLEDKLDYIGTFRVGEVYSPMYYNYDTDHIVIDWESELTTEEMESKIKELADDNDNRDDWSIEAELWMDRGHEEYSNMVRYSYKGHPVWFGMDSKDVAELKSNEG